FTGFGIVQNDPGCPAMVHVGAQVQLRPFSRGTIGTEFKADAARPNTGVDRMDPIDCLYIARELRHSCEIRFTGILYRVYESAILHIHPVLVAAFQSPLSNRHSKVYRAAESIQRIPVSALRILYGIRAQDVPVKRRTIQA